MSDKKLALKVFQVQLEKLNQIGEEQTSAWSSYTNDAIKKYLGPESKFLSHFGIYYGIFDTNNFRRDLERAKDVIQACIQYIELNGTYSPPNTNFITRLSEGWAIALFTFVVGTIWSMGFFIGDYSAKNRVDQDKVNLSNEVKRLKNENSILLRRPTIKPPQKNTEPKKNQVRK